MVTIAMLIVLMYMPMMVIRMMIMFHMVAGDEYLGNDTGDILIDLNKNDDEVDDIDNDGSHEKVIVSASDSSAVDTIECGVHSDDNDYNIDYHVDDIDAQADDDDEYLDDIDSSVSHLNSVFDNLFRQGIWDWPLFLSY